MNNNTIYGIIGYPLSHIFSPQYFNTKFKKEDIKNTQYLTFPMEVLDDMRKLQEQYPGLRGLNVTIPHKENVIPFLDDLDPIAKEVGAVNTIKIIGDKWIGYNTDIIGLRSSIADWLDSLAIQSALILGSGGASKSVAYVLKNETIQTRIISRSGQYTYGSVDENLLNKTDLIVNTTPLGMYPDEDLFPPIPYSFLNSKHFLLDLIYNPEKTIFLTRGEKRGAKIRNGLKMLHVQAEAAWDIWQDKTI